MVMDLSSSSGKQLTLDIHRSSLTLIHRLKSIWIFLLQLQARIPSSRRNLFPTLLKITVPNLCLLTARHGRNTARRRLPHA